MSDLNELLEEGFREVRAQCTDDDGEPVKILYNGKSADVVPASGKVEREFARSGYLDKGMVLVELFRSEVQHLGLVDTSQVEYGPRKLTMLVRIFDEDPTDPTVRLTLKRVTR